MTNPTNAPADAPQPRKARTGRNSKGMATHRVHIGYTATGRNRWRYFPTLSEAKAVCEAVFQQTGIVLSIEAMPERTLTFYVAA